MHHIITWIPDAPFRPTTEHWQQDWFRQLRAAALCVAASPEWTVLYRASQTTEVVAVNAGTTTIGDEVGTLFLTHPALIAAYTINMPATPVDKQKVVIASRSAVTAVTHNGNGNTLNAPLTALAANGYGTWQFVDSANTWYRIG